MHSYAHRIFRVFLHVKTAFLHAHTYLRLPPTTSIKENIHTNTLPPSHTGTCTGRLAAVPAALPLPSPSTAAENALTPPSFAVEMQLAQIAPSRAATNAAAQPIRQHPAALAVFS